MFVVEKLNLTRIPTQFEQFTLQCATEGINNNASVARMKIGRLKDDAWWYALDTSTDRIFSVSGCYPFDEVEPGSWRVLFRTATLRGYRAKFGRVGFQLDHIIPWSCLMPRQREWARQNGARRLLFTTNADTQGDRLSLRTNRFVQKVLIEKGLVKLYQPNTVLHGVAQNIWEVVE